MREKGEILSDSLDALAKIPGDGQVMVEHEHLFLEVWLDIRDILSADKEAGRQIAKLMLKAKGGD